MTIDLLALQEDYKDDPVGFFSKLTELHIIPFDVTESILDDSLQFGYLGSGPLIGHYVKITKIPLITIESDSYDFSNWIGEVVGDLHGRIVVRIENFFYGWIEKEAYELMNNFHQGNNSLN